MPAPTLTLTRVYGPVLLPSGEVPAHGRIRFTLRGWDTDGATMVAAATVEANLDAVGRFEAQLWASLAGARQLAYGVEVTWWSPALRALARQALPDIAVPAVPEVKLSALLTIPPPEPAAPDLLVQAAGFAAEAEAAAGQATTLTRQAIDLLAMGAPGVFASTADGIKATAVGAFFSVATTTDDSFLILYRHDTGGVSTEIARYPSAAAAGDGGGGADGASALRIPPEGETARLDFARAAGSVAGGARDEAGAPATLGSIRALACPRLYRRPEGLFGVSPPNTLRRDWPEGASPGALFEPAATVWAPLGKIGASADWTSLGVTLSDTTDIPPVAGETPQLLTASATGSANRQIGLMGVPLDVEWYQFDLIMKTGAAQAVMLRLPSEIGPAGGFGGGGWTVHINLVSGLILRNDPSGWVEAAPIHMDKIAADTWHLRLRFKPKQTSATEIFYVYAKSADTADDRNSTFTAGAALFTLGHASVQRCAAPRAPAAPVGMAVAVPAERLTLDVGGISADRRTGTFEVRFRLADGFPEDETTIVPIWKIAQATDPASRGLGVEIAGRAITAVLGRNAVPDTLAIRDVFAREFRVAFSHKDGKVALAVNGKTASAAFAPQALDEQWQTLFFGDVSPILAGTARPFSGTIGFWRYIPEALDEGALARLTRPERPIAPGEATPVIVDTTGQALMSADGGGRLDFTPGRRALIAQQSAIDPDGDLPGDAIAARLTGAGDVHFIASGYGAPFGERMQRATRLAAEDGLIVGNRGGPRFDAMWGNGQSLMYANTYGAPVNWPDHPWVLDVADGLDNSVFGFSSSGFASDRLRPPVISQDAGGGAGGVIYPAAHALARLDCARRDSPPPRIAKSIGQSGEQIMGLWPWGVYEADGVTVRPGMNEQHWLNVRRWHQSVADAVTRLGGSVTMPAHVWVHGTANENDASYYLNMQKSRADLNAITDETFGPFGQRKAPLWVMTQSGGRVNTSANTWPILMDQLRFCESEAGAVLAAPLCAPDITLADGNVHPDYASTTRFGELIGWAISEVRAGRRWTIGQPLITLNGAEVILDYAQWLRPGETLVIAADDFYGGAGIDIGKGLTTATVVDTATIGAARWGGPAAAVQSVEVINNGTAYRVTFDVAPSGPLGWELRYAYQMQDMSVADPLHYAHRGLLRTDWGAPSAILPGATLRRWLPSWKMETLI